MSEVLETEREPQRLDVHIKQIDLICYTIQITSGETFAPKYKYQSVIVSRIINKVIDIYTFSWEANNIRVDGDEERYIRRRTLQEKAIESCDSLLGLIFIAKIMFHQKGKQYKNWYGKIIKVKNLIMGWKKENSERYKKEQV